MRGAAAATITAVVLPIIAAPAAATTHPARVNAVAPTGGVVERARRVGLPSAVFNIPSGTPEQQNAIGHHVDGLVTDAPRGSLVRIAVYQFTSPAFAHTLVRAKRRGVRVRLVVDDGTRDSAAYREVARALGTSRRRGSWVVACHKGCIGDTIMHDKFFLFSRTGGAADVVVQSSANLTTGMRVRAWNNAFTVRDARLYGAYGRYFTALAAGRHHRDHYRVTRSGPITMYTFPRAGHTTASDTLYQLLGHVGCASGTAVHLTTFSLTRTAVARRLTALARQGCDVRVIYTNLGTRAREILQEHDGPLLLNSHYGYVNTAGDDVGAYTHSKYVVIDGTYSGRRRRIVITGSPNYTNPALRHNDEAMLRIEIARIATAYQRNFATLWHTVSTHAPLGGHVRDPR